MLCALIMAGGKGTRFWPLSTEEKPKQFLNLIGSKTMIQMTIDRIKPIIPLEQIFVCTGAKYVELVKEQLPELPEKNIIIEPEGRNTAPCIALSAFVIKRYYEDANMIVLPSDHLINKEEEFRSIIEKADKFVDGNRKSIVTLGIKPSRAETGYGYIKYVREDSKEVLKVEQFVEKPNQEVADKYLKSGQYLWNSGMFIWNVDSILNKIKKYLPKIYKSLENTSNISEKELQNYINENYHEVDNISIDYGVLEKDDQIHVITSDIEWDDIGTWKAVERYKTKDKSNNIVEDNVKLIESESNMTVNNTQEIVMIGVKDIMVIEADETLYIVNKKCMNDLKEYKNIITGGAGV